MKMKLLVLAMKFITLLYLYTPKIFKKINLNEKNRFYRSFLIRQTLVLLQKILKSLNYTLPITIKKDMTIIDVDGVLITPGTVNRYYKIPHNTKYHNEAKYLKNLFDFSEARNFIDIGACLGEYSIYFAKNYPESKVYSVEVEANNLKLLRKNIELNKCEKKIKIVENAVSDFIGQNYHVIENTQESEVIVNNKSSNLKTITLSSLINNEKLNKIDFLKVDIEGSNYKVAECIINNLSKISNIQYAFEKGPSEIFLNFIDRVKNFYDFYILESEEFKLIHLDDLKDKTKKIGPTPANKTSFDVYLKKKIS